MVKRYQLRGQSGPVVDQVFKLVELDFTLGRDLSNDVVISDNEVSRTHARLMWQDDAYVIQDLKSTNGTWINGRPVISASKLTAGDLVTLGKVSVFVYELIPEPVEDTTRIQDDSEPSEPIESTMLMPAWEEAAHTVRPVNKARGPRSLTQPSEASSGAGAVEERREAHPEGEKSAGKSFHQKYAACLQAGDLVGLMSQYHPDATLLSVNVSIMGTSGISKFFEGYFGGLGRFSAKPTGKYVEGQDSILCETNIETPHLSARVHDIFVFKDGKATHHFTSNVEVTAK